MGNRCNTTNCKADKHQNNCIKSIGSCSCARKNKYGAVEINDNCNICLGSGIKMHWTTCGHCTNHCNANSRTFVDLKSVQNTIKMYNAMIKKQQHEINQLKANQVNDDYKMMDQKEFNETTKEITNLTKKLEENNGDFKTRKKIYNYAKQIYKQQKAPVFIHKNIKQKIEKNVQKYKKANALPFTLTMDKDIKTFNRDKFKQEFSNKLNIPINAIKIISVTSGSTVVHTQLCAFELNGAKYTVGAIAEKMTEQEASKRLVEFGVFLAEFGDPVDTFKPLQQKILLNPKWNRIYDKDNITWSGTLNNDKIEPYYCPVGWKKYACKVTDTSEQFDSKYKSWPVAYHGTKFSLSMMISFTRLRAGGDPDIQNASGADCFGSGVYFSPSIEYAAHPLYAHPKKMSMNAKEYAGKWVQVALNCRIKPGSYSKHPGTIGDTSKQIDLNYNNNELEWLVHSPNGTYLDGGTVIFCGYMIRVTDNDPCNLPSSKWWNLSAYGNRKAEWYEK